MHGNAWSSDSSDSLRATRSILLTTRSVPGLLQREELAALLAEERSACGDLQVALEALTQQRQPPAVHSELLQEQVDSLSYGPLHALNQT